MSKAINHYFVDEAGDLVLFGRRGKILVGTEGCSRFFMTGVAYVPSPEVAEAALRNLRSELLADPYFKGVPSFQPEAGKTALFFHAKDDLPEVRREVMRLLPSLNAKIQVAIRRKDALLALSKQMASKGDRLTEAHLYNNLVKRLFRNLLHKADENLIVFSRRGKSNRTASLAQAIAKAKSNFEAKFQKPSDKPTTIISSYPSTRAGLQIIDYYLWALQRLYERGEDRYFEVLRANYRLIMDLDDTRNRRYGEWYSDSNPLEMRKLKPFWQARPR